MKRGMALIAISILALAIISTTVLAHYHSSLSTEAVKQLAKVKSATARYNNVKNAIRDGYISTIDCVEHPELGAMGIHYVKPSLIDGNLNVKKPEILVYIPTKRGFKLVAVEYFIPSALTNDETPMLFGMPFNGPMPGHMEGQPEHYDLHAWIWEKNPSGVFNDWNPNLHCPELESEED